MPGIQDTVVQWLTDATMVKLLDTSYCFFYDRRLFFDHEISERIVKQQPSLTGAGVETKLSKSLRGILVRVS